MPSRSTAEPYAARRAAGAASREATRARLLAAADDLFRRDGYAATTVSAIAARAGVSLQTLYLAWGSKTALFRAAADAAATASDTPLTPDAWRARIDDELRADSGTPPTAQDYLAEVARIFTAVAARSTTYWRMQPSAATTDPDIAVGFEDAMRQRRITMQHVASHIPHAGLDEQLSEQVIADTIWTLASPETYSMLTGTGGYTDTGYTAWLTRTLTAALCSSPTGLDPEGRLSVRGH